MADDPLANDSSGSGSGSGSATNAGTSFFGAHGAAGANVRVVCRVRPQNQREINAGGKMCISFDEDGRGLKLKGGYFDDYGDGMGGDAHADDSAFGGGRQFTFDKVFGPSCTQADVYDVAGRPIIESALQGYNGTVLCYGQTGSGKPVTTD